MRRDPPRARPRPSSGPGSLDARARGLDLEPGVTSLKPLAAAALRLRRRPGRKPGRRLVREASPAAQVLAGIRPPETVVPALCPPAEGPTGPVRRLLDLPAACEYLGGLSPWTLREWVRLGVVPVVKLAIPHPGRGRPFRKVLVDVRDLDRWVEQSKVYAPESEPALVARMAHARAARAAKAEV